MNSSTLLAALQPRWWRRWRERFLCTSMSMNPQKKYLVAMGKKKKEK